MLNQNRCIALIAYLFIIVIFAIINPSCSYSGQGVKVLLLDIEGGISPAQVQLLEESLGYAENNDHDLVLMRLDTPGGSGASMRDMVKIIMNSDIPICVWVGPEGAHAASAGVFIVAASQVAAMSPGTSIGSASPVAPSGEDLPETMGRKVKNDMASLIKGIARKRERNISWYVKAVEEGVSLDAKDAVALNVVNFIALSIDDYLEQLGARGVKINGELIRFTGSDVATTRYEPGLRYSVLSWLLDPQVAYFLLIGGMIGLFLELSHPGSILPGVVGGFCLITAFYALSILPTNAAGLLLLLFGLVLFILEIFVVSFGLLSVAAMISLFVGSLVLFRGGEMDHVPVGTIIGTVLCFSAFAVAVIYLVAKAQVRKSGVGIESMIGLEGKVLESAKGQMKVLVRGEIWNAVTQDQSLLTGGTVVSIVNVDGLTLIVVKKS